jgi:hypothetical protein
MNGETRTVVKVTLPLDLLMSIDVQATALGLRRGEYLKWLMQKDISAPDVDMRHYRVSEPQGRTV